MLDHYTKTVNAIYRILHVPTTWKILKELYIDLNARRIPSATRLAFFLGIFAASAYLSNDQLPLESTSGSLSTTSSELWFRYAVILLTNPPVAPSTLALQAYTGLVHLCSQIEGVTTGTFGLLSMSALQMARSMKIHNLDTWRAREDRKKNGADMVDIETKRRVWWHLVSSDWLVFRLIPPSPYLLVNFGLVSLFP
jgi:hypothetical protein